MSYVDAASAVLGPVDTRRQYLTGVGAAQSVNAKALTPRVFVTILAGAVAVRIRLAKESGLSGNVGATDILLPAFGRLDFLCEQESQYVYAVSSDGIATHQVWVWESSVKT